MELVLPKTSISFPEARRILRYLKQGIFPPNKIQYFTVGRAEEFRSIVGALEEVAQGRSRHFFFEGSYGTGKSHLLKAIESIGLDSGFGVTSVVNDGFTHAFNHPTRYLHRFFENMVVPRTESRGLYNLVRLWLNNEERNSLLSWVESDKNGAMSHPIRQIAMDGTSVYDFKGELECKYLLYRDSKAYHKVVYDRIGDLGSLCRAAGLKGMIFLFDEVESIATLLGNIRARYLSYGILNKLTDARSFANCLFCFAITPDFGEQLRKDAQRATMYDLEYRDGVIFVKKWIQGNESSFRLKKIASSANKRLCLGIRKVHEFAYKWNATDKISDGFVNTFVDEADKYGLSQREIIKTMMSFLDLAQQHSSFVPMVRFFTEN